MSGSIDGNPGSVGLNAPGLSGYPNATWGTRLRVATTSRTYAMMGLYNGDPTIRDNDNHGCDFSLHGPMFAIAEVGYQRNGHADDEGMIGNYKLGGYYNGGSFDAFNPSQFAPGVAGPPATTVNGNWGYYAVFDQVIYQPCGKSDPRALGSLPRLRWPRTNRSTRCLSSATAARFTADCFPAAPPTRWASA